MAKKSIALVIDADIARSSSLAPKPRPQNCQLFLRAVAENDHLLVMTPDLITEWNKHQSSFARKWRRKMYGRKKVRVAQPEHNALLCQRAEEAGETTKQRHAIFKDFHLVEAALATDKRIASMDETVRSLLSKAAIKQGVKELHSIVWVNPDEPAEEAINWLENGAPHEPERCLGYEEER